MLINLSNHSFEQWPKEQLDMANKLYSEVVDLPFPKIDPQATTDEIRLIVESYEIKVRKADPQAVHIMGEMTFTYMFVKQMERIGISCVASTTDRLAVEKEGVKTSIFKFVQFRNYF